VFQQCPADTANIISCVCSILSLKTDQPDASSFSEKTLPCHFSRKRLLGRGPSYELSQLPICGSNIHLFRKLGNRKFQEEVLGSKKNLPPQPDFEDNTYLSATEACFRSRRFPIEIIRPDKVINKLPYLNILAYLSSKK
jgi:hypothetical protein